MPRTASSLRAAPLALLFFGTPVIAACGGHVLSMGTNESQLKSVKPTDVGGDVAACPAGYAHPNVCCQGSAGVPSQCGAWIQHPFQACESGWTTYPNPLTCCSLKDDGNCIDTPSDAGAGVPTPPPPTGCGYMCPPGYYVPAGSKVSATSGECCTTDASGTELCFGWASASPGTGVANGSGSSSGNTGSTGSGGGSTGSGQGCAVDAGAPVPQPGTNGGTPDPSVDAGANDVDADVDASTPGCDPGTPTTPPVPPPDFDGGTVGQCGSCPDGWTPEPNAPDLCCRVDEKGFNECFSQASGPVSGPPKPPEPTDAGTPGATPISCYGSAPAASGGANGAGGTDASTGTATTSCGCVQEIQGHKDAIDCSVDAKGTTTCFCTQDGQSILQFGADGICDGTQVSAAMGKCFPIGL